MGIQFSLLRHWPRNISQRCPVETLEQLAKDKIAAKAEIYEVMERLAEKHGISLREVSTVAPYVDGALADLTVELEDKLDIEMDRASYRA